MTDAEIRGRLLITFNDRRHNAQGWVPTSDFEVSGGALVDRQVIDGICRQLADAGLIRWKPLTGANEGLIIGMAQITGHGVDVVQGLATPSIAVVFPNNASDAKERPPFDSEHPLAGIAAARIANWERYGVDAIEADLSHNNGITYVGGPPGTREQAWRWVRYKRSEERRPKTKADEAEVFTLKPGLWGMAIDLKAASRRAFGWWKRR